MFEYIILVKVYLPISFISAPLKGNANTKPTYNISFEYSLENANGFTFNSMVFEHKSTCINITLPQRFTGTLDDFKNWARTSGRPKLIDLAYVAQNSIIDIVKITFCQNSLYDALRYFGPSDWVYFEAIIEGESIFCQMNNLYFSAIMSAELVGEMPNHTPLAPVSRMMLRASTLVNSGYPTEGFLIAFATLDTTIQDSIVHGMKSKGLNEKDAKSHLRSILTNRAETYLTSLYQIVFGRSLNVDDSDLLKAILKINRMRNNAIHAGCEISREDAQTAISVILKAMKYLADSSGKKIDLPARIGI